MSTDCSLITLAKAPLTDAERLKGLSDAVATLAALEGQSSAIRLQRMTADTVGDRSLSEALIEREMEATEAEVTAMYAVVAQVKILFGNGVLDRCHGHLKTEVAGQV